MKRVKLKQKSVKREIVKPVRTPPATQEVKAELRADDDGMPPPPAELVPPA